MMGNRLNSARWIFVSYPVIWSQNGKSSPAFFSAPCNSISALVQPISSNAITSGLSATMLWHTSPAQPPA